MIYVRFWYGGASWDSRLIAFVETRVGGDALPRGLDAPTHVSIERRWRDGTTYTRWEGVEAVFPRVHRYNPQDKDLRHTRLYVVPTWSYCVPDPSSGILKAGIAESRIWDEALSAVGHPYALDGCLAAGLFCLIKRPDLFRGNRSARLQCAEETTRCLRAGGCEPFPDHRIDVDATPAALEGALIALHWTQVPAIGRPSLEIAA